MKRACITSISTGNKPALKILVFKPDGIGDFVLATGAIRLLADTFGASRITLVVRDVLGPLARAQFPEATVVELPWKETRTFVNLFAVNAFRLAAPLLRVRRERYDVAVSLRHMRDYLQNAFFFGVRAKRFVATENLLARNGRWSRLFVEALCETIRRPYWLGYPEAGQGVPTELEAHRRVMGRVLGRTVEFQEILPVLRSENIGQRYVVCAPLSAQESKDYPFEAWCEAIVQSGIGKDMDLRLCGSRVQAERLGEFAARLEAAGFGNVSVILPESLQELVDLVAGARVVWAVDTAAAHMAVATGRPCAIIFSGLNKGMFAPWQRNDRQYWLQPEAKKPDEKRRWHERIPSATVAEMIRGLEKAIR